MYTVYKTTCLVNQKFYIGVHKTDDPKDDYLGSGKLIKQAIRKYGKEQFRKEILLETDSAHLAFLKEKELVTQELVDSETCYNLKLGGEGGFDWINTSEMVTGWKSSGGIACQIKHPELVLNMRQAPHGRVSKNSLDALRRSRNTAFKGKTHSPESKAKMSTAKMGANNSQFGSIWINNGTIAKKHRGEIPVGWSRGKKVSHAD